MCVCQFIVAIIGTVIGTSDPAGQKALIAFVCIYIYFFASSWGPCAWVVTGEIFPLKVRAKSLSMTTASNWLLNWAIGTSQKPEMYESPEANNNTAYATPYLVDTGPGDAVSIFLSRMYLEGYALARSLHIPLADAVTLDSLYIRFNS